MATQRSLLIVADYPYVEVQGRMFAQIPWDAAFADLYRSRFERILLLGRRRTAATAPPGWFPVDETRFTVIDGGDWYSVAGFVLNLPRLIEATRATWDRTAVLHCRLFYLNSVAVWCFNRVQRSDARKPVATLLVGDAADAVLLRDDLLRFAWMRRMASAAVAGVIRAVQKRVEVAGYVAKFLADKFATPGAGTLVAGESWLHANQVRRHDRQVPRTPCTVLFVGRLVELKRPRMLLEVVGRLVNDGLDLRCVVVGDGPEKAALERLARDRGIEPRVRFTGWLGLLSPGMLSAYDEADVFCLPSFTEGQALVLIEAMGRGVAVVATAVGGTPEIVIHEQTGLLIPRDDPPALEAALRRYLAEPQLWRRCVEGGYEVSSRCTFETMRGRLADVIGGLSP